jgi:hypothetical protein
MDEGKISEYIEVCDIMTASMWVEKVVLETSFRNSGCSLHRLDDQQP